MDLQLQAADDIITYYADPWTHTLITMASPFTLQTSPVTPPVTPRPTSSAATDTSKTSDPTARLDALLEIYLDHLDTYQKLREELSKNLSAGFLSLAQANRTSNLGSSGRRYGEEGYDDRMKAGRIVKVHVHGDGDENNVARQKDLKDEGQPRTVSSTPERIVYAVVERSNRQPELLDSKGSTGVKTSKEIAALEMSPLNSTGSPRPNLESAKAAHPTTTTLQTSSEAYPNSKSAEAGGSDKAAESIKSKKKKLLNPLNWYGLLVPPSLRAAQTSFTSAVDDHLPRLLNAQVELSALEAQIRQLRQEAGLSS